jgi:hypothetical protein
MKRLLFIPFVLLASHAWAVGAPVRIDGGDTITALADVTVTTTATIVRASNANRASLNCTTDQNVRWGDSSSTITKGQLLIANSSIAIANTAAVYMIAESAAANVSCTEETWASSSSGGPIFSP